MAAASAFHGLALLMPAEYPIHSDTSPHTDVTTPRTWSGSSRAPSTEPVLAPVIDRDVADIGCARHALAGRGARAVLVCAMCALQACQQAGPQIWHAHT